MKKISVFPSVLLLTICALVLMTFVVSGQTYTNGDWTYTLNADDEVTITSYSGPGGAVTIPNVIDGKSVTRLGSGSSPIFGYGNTTVSNVTIPGSVTVINRFAFSGCNGLNSITIPGSVTSIEEEAFNSCASLTSLNLNNGLTYIGDYTFAYCNLSGRIEVPPTARYWGQSAFDGNPLITLVMPHTVVPTRGALFQDFPGRVEASTNSLAGDPAFIAAVVAALQNYQAATKSDVSNAVTSAASNSVAQVQASPNNYNLFTLAQNEARYNEGITTGTSLVTANPSSYNLYDSNSIMDLRMNGLVLQKNGTNAVVSFQPQTTTDLTQPFTNNGTPITHEVPMPGNKGFIRINAKP